MILRDIEAADLPVIFSQQLDPDANYMAAFTSREPSDKAAFMVHWAKILDDSTIIKKAIIYDGQVAGNIGCFEWGGKRQVGYWIGREYWGKGLATRALTEILGIVKTRPLYAHAAADNIASIRVLQKCGFTITGYEKSFANARGEEIEEAILELR
jgi:RimJ/RimL family protein N-acetyltransferase